MDPAFKRPPTPAQQVEGLAMFDVTPPDIQTPAPSQPGSRTSEDAAKCVSNPLRTENHRKIMRALYGAALPISMAELVKRTGLAINIITARLSELRPLWVQQFEGACRSAVKPSLRVDGFMLTKSGLDRCLSATDMR